MGNHYTDEILSVKIDFGLTCDENVALIEKRLLEDLPPTYICTTNPEFILLANKHADFKHIINESFLSVPDGSGVLMAKKYIDTVKPLKKNPIRYLFEGLKVGFMSLTEPNSLEETVTGVELTEKICKLSHEKNYSIFFLGGWPKDWLGRNVNDQIDISNLAANKIREKYPNVNIIGSTSQFSKNENDDAETLEFIHDCMNRHNIDQLDFIFVAYNQYTQEKWIKRNINKIPAKIGIGIGRTFDYLSGYINKPPIFTYKYHISWLFSMIQHPWKLKRVLNAFPLFPIKVYLKSLKDR